MKYLILLLTMFLSGTWLSAQQLDEEGYEVFSYQDGDSTFLMRKYYFCVLRKGEQREHSPEEVANIQAGHMKHLSDLAREGKICIAGPFGDDGDERGIVIFKVKSLEEARKLAGADPAVISGRLVADIRPWWGGVGSKLE